MTAVWIVASLTILSVAVVALRVVHFVSRRRRLAAWRAQPRSKEIDMGQVKDAITKVTPRPIKPLDTGLLDTAERLRDELSRCTSIKDDDTLGEGDDLRAENTRKATQLRAAHTLMSGVCALLEDYS